MQTGSWSREAQESYALELELQVREVLSYMDACATHGIQDYRKHNRSHFIESAKQNLRLETTDNFCMPLKFLACHPKSGKCACQDSNMMEWSSALDQCTVTNDMCRSYEDKIQNRVLTFDTNQSEIEVWKYPLGIFCPKDKRFCGNLNYTEDFFFKPAKYNWDNPIVSSSSSYGSVVCMHCNVESTQANLIQQFTLKHGDECKYEYKKALLAPTESEKMFLNRLENLDLLASSNETAFCKLDHFLTCVITSPYATYGTCQCISVSGLISDRNGSCFNVPLAERCGSMSLKGNPYSPIPKDMEIPVSWAPPFLLTCDKVGSKQLRCSPIDEINTKSLFCLCPEGNSECALHVCYCYYKYL